VAVVEGRVDAGLYQVTAFYYAKGPQFSDGLFEKIAIVLLRLNI
jgi:hypothetical protein